jgi:nondiscriminating aspartyl-tRNA synthetase
MTFLVIRDRSGLAQAVLTSPERVAAAAELPEETVVAVTGTVVASDQAPDGAEISQPVITPLSGPEQPPPFPCTGRRSPPRCRPSWTTRRPACGTRRAPFEISAT